MDIEAKKKAILKACKTFSKTQLDPRGKGRYILSLERKDRIAEEKVNEIYENTLRLQVKSKGKQEALDKTLHNALDKKAEKLDNVLDNKKALPLDNVLDNWQNRLQQLEKTVQELDTAVNLILARQKGLEDRLASLEASSLALEDKHKATEQGKNNQATKLLDFALVQKKTSSAGRQYQKWYAVKRIEGKQVWVYVGENVNKAEAKIKAWIGKQQGKKD